jgi:hypothetical protein
MITGVLAKNLQKGCVTATGPQLDPDKARRTVVGLTPIIFAIFRLRRSGRARF